MHSGAVPHPTGLASPSSIWHAQGPWLDHETIASGVFAPDEVIVMRTDGTIVDRIPSPEDTGGIVYFFGCAVEHVDGTLLVLAGRVLDYTGPVLHAYRRENDTGPWRSVARVELPGPYMGPESALARITIEAKQGGLSERRILVAWPSVGGHRMVVLTPTGKDLAWSMASTTMPASLYFSYYEYQASFQGSVIAMRTGTPTWNCAALTRVGEDGSLSYAGCWPSTFVGGYTFGMPAVLDDGTVLVGQLNMIGGGTVHRLQDINGTWTSVEQVQWPLATDTAGWGLNIATQGSAAVVSCARPMPNGLIGSMLHREADGSLTHGATLVDSAGSSTGFTKPIERIQFAHDGALILETAGQPYPVVVPPPPWQFLQLRHALDLDLDGVPDHDSIGAGRVPDCNANGVPDSADMALGIAADAQRDGIPDACEADCDRDGTPDYAAITAGATDCDGNGVPDDCQLAAGAPDLDGNGALDTCGQDCNENGISDLAELAGNLVDDCNGNGVPDTCESYRPPALPGVMNSGLGPGVFFWRRLDPAVPTLRALDVVFSGSEHPLMITIIRDPSGQANHTQATAEDVVLHIIRQMPVLPPLGPSGVRPPVRVPVGEIDLSGSPAFWVRVTNASVRSGVNFGVAPVDGMVRWTESSIAGLDPVTVALLLRSTSAISTSWTPYVTLLAESCASPADLDVDGRVNGRDLGALLQQWGCIWCSHADLDQNGIVAGGDLAILLAEWSP